MAKSRDCSSGIYIINYSPVKVILYLSEHGEGTTADIRECLDCAHSTALKKLHSLADVGVLDARQIGNAYVWSLSTDRISETVEADLDPAEAETLLSEAFDELATERSNSSNELPGDVQAWIENRGIPKTVSTSEYAFRMAIFRRFLHAMLYSLHVPEHAELTPLSPGDDWDARFELVRESVEDSGLSRSPVDDLLTATEPTLDAIILALQHAIAGTDNPAEALANTYEELVPQEARRELGQFATPPFVSQFMASWTVQQADDIVLDPGIGAGQLAAQALVQKEQKGANQPLEEIVGIDIDEIAISMAAVTLKLTDGTGQGNLRHGDFINQSPQQFAASGFELERYDAVVANPPYSRHQALEDHVKKRLNRVVSSETDYEFSQRTPLYGYFLIHAAQYLSPGGRMAAIIPSRIFDTKFGEDLKEYLLNEFSIHGIIQFDSGVDIFESVKATPSIMLLEKGDAPKPHKTTFQKVSSWADGLTPEQLLSDADSEAAISARTDIAQELLSHKERWSFYLCETEFRDFPEATDFKEIATIQRGIATGANDFFCLTQKEAEEWSIPRTYRKPIIRSARGLSLVNITTNDWEQWKQNSDEVWLLYCYTSECDVCERSDIDSTGVLEYLNKGKATGASDGHLVSNRDPWYRVEKQSPAPILGKYMNRTGFLFMRNDADLLTLNNVHTIDLDFEFSQKHLNALLAYLNSNVIERVLSAESHDYNGLQKLEISQLEDTPVIDPRRLSESKRRRLTNLFDYLCRIRRMDLDESGLLRAIDDEIEPLLGLETESGVGADSE